MRLYAIDHVQIAIPPGAEETARTFYTRILGLTEVPKPPELAGRGGAWFAGGAIQLHLGVEQDFRPARKAHPAFLVEGLDALIERCRANAVEVTTDVPLEGYRRIHVADPFGNRIELMEKTD